jgi:hypothetical protein
MQINTTDIEGLGRDLLDQHLTVLAEAESRGFTEIIAQMNYLWSLHASGIATAQEYLYKSRFSKPRTS